jgi:hypothetical protein
MARVFTAGSGSSGYERMESFGASAGAPDIESYVRGIARL